jgi:DNA polymerase V
MPYKRAGVILSELNPRQQHQQDLFDNDPNPKLNILMDEINQRFGRDMIVSGRLTGHFKQWKMRQENLSKAYTTDWQQLMLVV